MGGVSNKITKIWRALRHRITVRALLCHRVAGALEHQGALRNLHCRTIVDIGANRGQFALVARCSFPDAKIISFEPLPGPAERYQRVFKGDKYTTLHNVAVGSGAGEATIHVSQREDSSSLLPITEKQNALFPGTSEKSTEYIRVGRLGEYISKDELKAPALLKIDVQGYELEALKGSEDLLCKFDHIYAECSFVELYHGQAMASEVIDYLKKQKFTLDGVYNVSYDRNGIAIQADFLFGRKEDKE